MKNKRIIAAAIMAVVVFAASGCSSSEETKETTTAGSGAATAAVADSGEPEEKATEAEEVSSETYLKEVTMDDIFKMITSDVSDLEDEDLKKLAQSYVDEGYTFHSAEECMDNAFPIFATWEGDEPNAETFTSYLYRGFQVVKEENGYEVSYVYAKATPEILENDLGFTKISEEGDQIKYDAPDEYSVYCQEYVFDKTTSVVAGCNRVASQGGVG